MKTTSTKYTTVYPYKLPESSVLDTASQENFTSNTKIYGDAIRETTSLNAGTSNSDWNASSWNKDYSSFSGSYHPLFMRGGFLWSADNAGVFSFHRNMGDSIYTYGFRAVLVNI